jgi:glycosyltransferase involved in cell wall biosynthesis
MANMNVLIVRNAQYKSNASLHRVINALSEINYNITVLSRDRNSNIDNVFFTYVNNKKVTVHEIGLKSKYGKNLFGIFNVLYYNLKVKKYCMNNSNKIDIFHAYDLDTGYIIMKFAKKHKKKFIYHIADFYSDSRGSKYKFLSSIIRKKEFSVINNSDSTIICTEERKQQIEGSNPKSLYVVHNTPILHQMGTKHVLNKVITLTYIGALTENRFISKILTAIQINSHIKLIIAGEGKMRDYVYNVSKNNQCIDFVGSIDYDNALELIEKTDLMIAMYDPQIKNHYFAAPNKIYESISYKKPIIVAKGTGLSSIVEEYDFGWVIDYSLDALNKLLSDIVKNPGIIEIKSMNASKAYQSFNWEKTKSDIQNIYLRLEK